MIITVALLLLSLQLSSFFFHYHSIPRFLFMLSGCSFDFFFFLLSLFCYYLLSFPWYQHNASDQQITEDLLENGASI